MPDSIDLAQDSQIAFNNSAIQSSYHKLEYNDGIPLINGKKIICKRCKKPIPKKRLKILPKTTVCTHCSQMISNGATLDDYDPDEEI